MKTYELTLILQPELVQEALNKLIQDIASFIQEKGGLLERQELKGRQKKGILTVLAFSLRQEEIEALNKKIKGEKGVVRSMMLVAHRHIEKVPTVYPKAKVTQEKPMLEEVKLTVEEIDKKLEEIFKTN